MSKVKEHAIIMSAPMMLAYLAGRKTLTQRIVTPHTERGIGRGKKGDVVWFKENARVDSCTSGEKAWYGIAYAAGGSQVFHGEMPGKWFPAIARKLDGSPRHCSAMHMPRWACRAAPILTADVERRRLHEMTEQDAMDGGIRFHGTTYVDGILRRMYGVDGFDATTAVAAYQVLWNRIHGPGSWAANPFVWVVEFERDEAPHEGARE